MKDQDLFWAVGLFEGEGYIGKDGHSRRMKVAMKDEDIVRRFHAAVGCGSVRLDVQTWSGREVRMWTWTCTLWADVSRLLDLFYPHLGERRQAKANQLLGDPPKSSGAHNKVKTHCPQGHEYTESNTRVYNGSRSCRRCAADSAKVRARA